VGGGWALFPTEIGFPNASSRNRKRGSKDENEKEDDEENRPYLGGDSFWPDNR